MSSSIAVWDLVKNISYILYINCYVCPNTFYNIYFIIIIVTKHLPYVSYAISLAVTNTLLTKKKQQVCVRNENI